MVLFSPLLQERGRAGTVHLLTLGRTGVPTQVNLRCCGGGRGRCHPAWACAWLLPGKGRLCPPSAPLHPRRSPLPSQEPENKLGLLRWEWGTLQTALSSPRLLTPREICFTQMMLTCLLQVPRTPASSSVPTLPAMQREASLCRAHSWHRGCPFTYGWELASLV